MVCITLLVQPISLLHMANTSRFATEEVLEFKCLIFGQVAKIKALENLSESDPSDGTELVGMIVAC